MIKKTLLSITAAVSVILSISACGASTSGGDTAQAPSPSADQTSDAIAPAPAPEPKKEEAKEEGDLGQSYVAIKSASFGNDWEGNPAIIVSYDYTNNADGTQSASVALHVQAFQNGISLESTFFSGNDLQNENQYKNIKPGVTLTDCQNAFTLSDNSPVTIEITEFLTFSKKMVTKIFDVQI